MSGDSLLISFVLAISTTEKSPFAWICATQTGALSLSLSLSLSACWVIFVIASEEQVCSWLMLKITNPWCCCKQCWDQPRVKSDTCWPSESLLKSAKVVAATIEKIALPLSEWLAKWDRTSDEPTRKSLRTRNQNESNAFTRLPVVPHKAVAEVSKIGNL